MAEIRCVNDTNGDGDCAACARNPNAPCRQCVGCRLTGRCAEHPANGRLSLVDCAAEFRELYGDDAEDAALRLHRRLLPAHDWRFMVEYGPRTPTATRAMVGSPSTTGRPPNTSRRTWNASTSR